MDTLFTENAPVYFYAGQANLGISNRNKRNWE
jgi:hypothetical protein